MRSTRPIHPYSHSHIEMERKSKRETGESEGENKVQNETIIVLHRCDLTAHFVIDNNLLLLKKVIYRAHVNFLSCLIT